MYYISAGAVPDARHHALLNTLPHTSLHALLQVLCLKPAITYALFDALKKIILRRKASNRLYYGLYYFLQALIQALMQALLHALLCITCFTT